MRRLFIVIILPLVLLTTACEKDKGSEPEAPTVINITTPGAGTIYINGSTMKIEGDMADNNVLSTARVEIKNKSNGNILFQASSPTGNVGFFRFLWNWPVTGVAAPFTATVKVTAKDKLSNEVSKEVDVQLDQ